MRYQNRVTPFGQLIATSARGTLMGNRGILHDAQQQVIKRWAHQQWIHCVLDFKGRRRQIMSPGKYTELFFLDEPTALAAGHRPCGECQRPKYKQFKALMEAIHGRSLKSAEIDKILHKERLMWQTGKRTKQKRTFSAELQTLPDFTFVAIDESTYLWRNGEIQRWTPFGYDSAEKIEKGREVEVLTPFSIVEVLRRGYQPSTRSTSPTG